MQADIDALGEVRANVARLYAFWRNHLGHCHTDARARLSLLLGAFYGVFLRVPMEAEFAFDGYTPQGLVRYINTDYCAGPALRSHSPQLDTPLRELWRALAATHAEFETTWTLPPPLRRQYHTLLDSALASVRSWLRIPGFAALRTRELQGNGRTLQRRL